MTIVKMSFEHFAQLCNKQNPMKPGFDIFSPEFMHAVTGEDFCTINYDERKYSFNTDKLNELRECFKGRETDFFECQLRIQGAHENVLTTGETAPTHMEESY